MARSQPQRVAGKENGLVYSAGSNSNSRLWQDWLGLTYPLCTACPCAASSSSSSRSNSGKITRVLGGSDALSLLLAGAGEGRLDIVQRSISKGGLAAG